MVLINKVMPNDTKKYNLQLSFMVDKLNPSEYISNDSSSSEDTYVKEELSNISRDDEAIVIKYLLDIMRVHDIITEEEYQAVLYKYN